MDVLKRAWLYVTRKKKKSIIMLFLLFSIATAVLSGISIKKATEISKKAATSELSSFFRITNEITSDKWMSREVIDKILTFKEIKKYDTEISLFAVIKDLKKVKPKQEASYTYDGLYDENTFELKAHENTEADLRFVNKSLKLIEGRHIIKNDKNKVLIHKELAKLNNLKVGSRIILNKEDKHAAEIVGIFDSTNGNSERNAAEPNLIENYILCDNNYVTSNDKNAVYTSATFYSDPKTNIDSVIEKAKKLSIDWSLLRIEKSEDIFLALSKSFATMDKIVNMMLLGTIVIGAGILSLILIFWIQGRVHETGILLSIGVPKFKIISQYVIELLLISIIGFSLSYFSGQLIAQNVGESIISKASSETVQEVKYGSGFALGDDPESSMLTHTVNDIDVKVTPGEMIYVWAVGSFIITASVAISSISIIRIKPKEILSKMS